MILSHAMRIIMARQLGPFSFRKDIGYFPDPLVPNLGLYVHIPFCKEICSFCPYYKIKAKPGDTAVFLNYLLSEIQLVSEKVPRKGPKCQVTSLYFGGGSPAIMVDDLYKIRKKIDESFQVEGNSGIELHPRDVCEGVTKILHDSGFDMVSLGVQSFSKVLLKNLGRKDLDSEKPLRTLVGVGFKAIDVDLIFGIPGQKESDLRTDFLKAVELGASQVSTYPFIDFSYAKNKKKPLGHSEKKRMLGTLLKIADEAGFSRTSVWTFGRKNVPRYSSVTRDCYIGFGPSATSLGLEAFKVNTFSVKAYSETVSKGIIPTALRMPFTPRTRRLYWLFWNCYNGFLSESVYHKLFLSKLSSDFPWSLQVGTRLGFFKRFPDGWALTEKGSYYFHRIEHLYTHQYIDKTWHLSMKNPWPEKIDLY